jgi:hypothetical protein
MTRLSKLFFSFIIFSFLSITAAYAEMDDYPIVKLQSLDKGTARTMTFEVKVGSTVRFGPLFIKPQACRKAPPIEKPESAAFLQIWEINHKNDSEWVFSGWMFASSPALSSMDHPIYDVWVLDCQGDIIEPIDEEELIEESTQQTDPQLEEPQAEDDENTAE